LAAGGGMQGTVHVERPDIGGRPQLQPRATPRLHVGAERVGRSRTGRAAPGV